MSLATSGGLGGAGGGGGGGLVLGHQAGGQLGHAPGAPPPPTGGHGDTGHGPPPPSAAVLGADLLDRQQQISLKNVRNTTHLPLVGIDLCTAEPHIAYFPPKPLDPSESTYPSLVGKMKARVNFKKGDEVAHKTLRKYLGHKASYVTLQSDTLTTKTDDAHAVVLERPQRWLGIRRLEDTNHYNANVKEKEKKDPLLGVPLEDGVVGVRVVNSTLDGAEQPQQDDYDRVVYHVRLAESKKKLSILPEEATQLLLHQAQLHVAAKVAPKDIQEDDGMKVLCYPLAIALPTYYCHDACVEAVLEAAGSTSTAPGVVFQRSICALAGALMLGADGKPNALLERIQIVRAAMAKEYQRAKVEDPDNAVYDEEVTLLMVGITDEGVEATAIQVSDVQEDLVTCLFGEFRVLANVSYQDPNPTALLARAMQDLYDALEIVAPEADGPAGLVTYGTPAEQDKVRKQLVEVVKTNVKEWSKVPVFVSKSDSVAIGTALLGAIAHGRQLVLYEKGDRTKAELGIRVQNVAPCAVGIRLNYHGDDDSKWTDVKTIFDFDRRLPAGPYPIEFKASECVIHREQPVLEDKDEEAFLKAAAEKDTAKYIPEREEAALNLKVQLVQKWTRSAEWKNVGDPIEALVKLEDGGSDDGDGEADEKRVAVECMTLELSLGIHGMITTCLIGDRQSVVQATQSARNSAIRYYVGIIVAILFFGGFLARSYWEEWSFNRDTEKLLAYYKHVLPGSISDGDVRNAQHIVWRFRGKRKALWEKLERKYGEPVREPWQWEDYDADASSAKEHDETVDLDGEDEDESSDEL